MYEISLLTDSNTDHLHVAPAQQRHKVHTPGRGKWPQEAGEWVTFGNIGVSDGYKRG